MNRTLAVSALLLLAPVAFAQRQPLPGVPMTPPPVNHPGLLGQPLFGDSSRPGPSGPSGSGGGQVDPAAAETRGAKLEGKNLKKAVAKVKALHWLDSLAEAKVKSAATGKPILWLQALGDIDGFA